MVTYVIITSMIYICLGHLIGRLIKGMNPFKLLAGLVLSASFLSVMEQEGHQYLLLAFGVGFVSAWTNPLYWMIDRLPGTVMGRDPEPDYDDIGQQQRNHSSPNHDEAMRQQYRTREEDLQRQAEALERQREAFRQEQASQSHHHSPPPDDLDPSRFAHACHILGIEQTASLADAKKAYRSLSMKYHPDKMTRLPQSIRQQAEAIVKLLNAAMETVTKHHKNNT